MPRGNFCSFPHTWFFWVFPAVQTRVQGISIITLLHIHFITRYYYFLLPNRLPNMPTLPMSLHHPRPRYHHLWWYIWATTSTTSPSPDHSPCYFQTLTGCVSKEASLRWRLEFIRQIRQFLEERKAGKLGQKEKLSYNEVSTEVLANTVVISEDGMSLQSCPRWEEQPALIPLHWAGYESWKGA